MSSANEREMWLPRRRRRKSPRVSRTSLDLKRKGEIETRKPCLFNISEKRKNGAEAHVAKIVEEFQPRFAREAWEGYSLPHKLRVNNERQLISFAIASRSRSY